ncbi:MAG TPA: protein kinase, partial [Kofleriaceae bacterium]
MIIEPASDDPLIGTMINGYRVMQTIGRGGMGAVYRAVQPTIDAEVAIKVLGDELAREPEAVERFIAEAKMANLVRHEGLVKVIGLGVLPDGRPYQIMEHLTGLPLSSVIHPDIPLGTLCMRLAEALRAIGAMHARGIIHRDLKPANLFVTTAGYIKVLDFGIAKLAHTSGLTRTGHAIGTPEYMSPEQAEAAAIDHRSDIYSMGIVVYECVTGVRPFEGRVVEAMVLRERPPRVEPASLDAIVQTAMAAEPRDRFADAEAMACALERAADGLPEGSLLENPTTSAPPPTPATLAPSEAAPTVVAKPSALPARLGRYVIEGLVGRGAHGQVLVAHDPRVERKVALKLVSARGSERERVLAEARAMAKVNHPNVVTLFELGEDGDHVFLAMEYLDAIDLEGWLAAEPRAWDAIVARFVEAGRGLAAAHAAGVVHRDFKP